MRTISEEQLRSAVDRAGLPDDTLQRILLALNDEPATSDAPEMSSVFEAAHISYYFGAFLIIGAMGWFVTTAWDRLSGVTLFTIASAYAVLFGGVGLRLYRQAATRTPGGMLVAVAVCMTPLAVYGLELQMGWWPGANPRAYSNFHPHVDGNWVLMEVATIALAALALRWVRFPFLTAPAAYAFWFLSMDAPSLLFGARWSFHQECWISVGFGLVLLVAAYLLDGASELDFSFWFYFFGLIAFSGGLTLLGDGNELGKAIYCLVHLLLIALSILLQRRAFLVFGTIGVFLYLIGEAEGYFRNSMSFTLALTLIGALFIAAGIVYKRKERSIAARLQPLIPVRILQRHRRGVAGREGALPGY